MPVQITLPSADGQPWGPGFYVSGGAGAGPLPTDQFWVVELFGTPTGEGSVISTTLASRSLGFNEIAWDASSAGAALPAMSDIAHGTPGLLRVSLRNSSQVIIEQAQRPVVIDWQSGMPWLMQSNMAAGTGSFTQADRDTATKTLALAGFPLGVWLPIIETILENIASLPYEYELIEPIREGEGTLTRPSLGKNVFATGIRFQVMYAPPGIGFDEGAPDSFSIDVLELGFIADVPGTTEMLVESRWYRDQTGTWRWNFDFPHEVRYWIAPGVGVRFWWVKLPGPMTRQ